MWKLSGWQVIVEKSCHQWGRSSSSKLIFPLHQWLRCTIPQSDFWEVLLKSCLLGALQLIHNAETWNQFSCVRANRWPFPRRRYWAFCTDFVVWWKSRLTETAKSEGWIISYSWVISYWCRRSWYTFVVMLLSSISSPLGKDIKGWWR